MYGKIEITIVAINGPAIGAGFDLFDFDFRIGVKINAFLAKVLLI